MIESFQINGKIAGCKHYTRNETPWKWVFQLRSHACRVGHALIFNAIYPTLVPV